MGLVFAVAGTRHLSPFVLLEGHLENPIVPEMKFIKWCSLFVIS